MTTQRKHFVTTVTATGASRSADEPEMTVSTATPDREGDRVLVIDATAFKKNPTMFWNHAVRDLPIATVTGLTVEPGRGLRARWRWLAGDPMAERVKNAWDQGVVRAASIGFLSRRREPNAHGGVDHLDTELLEISLVGLPANAEAVRALKRLGLEPRPGSSARDAGHAPVVSDADHVLFTDEEVLGIMREVVAEQVAERLRMREDVRVAMTALADELGHRVACRLTGRVD